jgi:prefoldin subunit 5
LSALACIVALVLAGAPASSNAQTTAESIASARAAIDATANRWFDAQRQASGLDAKIAALTKTLSQLEDRVDDVRVVADARAVELYESDTQALTGVISGNVMGGDPLELGRRAALIGQSNANGQVAIDELEAAINDLHARRDQLDKAKAAQIRSLRDLSARRHTLDAELGSLQVRSARAAERTQLAAAVVRDESPATSAAPTGPAVAAPDTTPAPQIPILAAVPVTSSVSPHHDEPFLVCTRVRESSGNYRVISSAGYYGAYQFARTTWNVTATHAGRLDLVGMSPSQASDYDQDEMAWTLFNWQGNSPWGGRC